MQTLVGLSHTWYIPFRFSYVLRFEKVEWKLAIHKIVWRGICLDLLPFHREAYTTLFGKCQCLARNKVYVLLVFSLSFYSFLIVRHERRIGARVNEWVNRLEWVSDSMLLLLLLLLLCCCWRWWCFSFNGCFQLENCFILLHVCIHTFWAKWMWVVCRSTQRLHTHLN